MRRFIANSLLFWTLIFAVGAVSSDGQQSLTAAEIVNKHLSAVGGRQPLAGFKSRVAIGTVKKENDPEFRMAIVSEAPDRVSAIYVFENYDWHLTYDGNKAIVSGIRFPRARCAHESTTGSSNPIPVSVLIPRRHS